MTTPRWARVFAAASIVSSLASLAVKIAVDSYVWQTAIAPLARGEAVSADLPAWIDHLWIVEMVLAATGLIAALISVWAVPFLVRVACLVLATLAVVFLFLLV